jgi:hypothetical protein
MGDEKSRIIVPGNGGIQHPGSRVDRCGSMAEMNKQMARVIKEQRRIILRQVESIKAMNAFLTDLAVTVGAPVPKSAVEGIDAIEKLRARVIALAEKEKVTMSPPII